MADEKNNQEASGKKLPLKMIVAVLLALLLEGGVIAAIFMFASGPESVKADNAAAELALTGDQPVETLVVAGKFQNTRTGRAYLYDVEVWIVVKQKYNDEIEAKKEAIQAAIKSDVTTIFRRAEPAHLHEHDLATLTRQIRKALDERFGYDPDGAPYVEDCFLAEFKEFRAD